MSSELNIDGLMAQAVETAMRDAWRSWLDDNERPLLAAIGEGIDAAIDRCFPDAQVLTDAIATAVQGAWPHPSAILDAIRYGVADAKG